MNRTDATLRSRLALLTIGILGTGWLAWPIWSSFTAPGRDALQAETPFLLAAVLGLLALLATSIWLDAGRRAEVFGPVLLVVLVDVVIRLVLSPGSSGIEPVYALPCWLELHSALRPVSSPAHWPPCSPRSPWVWSIPLWWGRSWSGACGVPWAVCCERRAPSPPGWWLWSPAYRLDSSPAWP